jgi:selenocysteine-specific elongation factor
LAGMIDAPADEKAGALLSRRGIASIDELRAHSGGGSLSDGIVAGSMVMIAERVEGLAATASVVVGEFHAANPLRPGIPKASLASQLGIDAGALSAVLDQSPELVERGSAVAQRSFRPELGSHNEAEWDRIHETLSSAGLTVPRLKDLGIDQELAHVLIREKRIVKVSDDFVYLPDQLVSLQDRLTELPARFTVSDFRDAFELTRKYAVPLLEWLDLQRITIRDGDNRRLA